MIPSDATLPYEQSSPVYGSIFSHSTYQSQRAELPSLGTFLSQGAAVGSLLAVIWPVMGMVLHPENGYNFLLLAYLPVFLGAGALFGLCEATAFWAVSYFFNHRIHPIVRAVLGPVILVTLVSTYGYLVWEASPYDTEVSTTDYLGTIGIYAVCGVVLGLVIGSPIKPIAELIRGTAAERLPVMNALTGLALRLIVIFGLMVSILSLILSTQEDFHLSEFTMSAIAVSHFAVAVLIVFARTPFWLLLPVAIVIHFPIVTLVTDVLKPDELFVRVITLIYLALWGGFLLCRASVPRGALAWIKRELRYYFIE